MLIRTFFRFDFGNLRNIVTLFNRNQIIDFVKESHFVHAVINSDFCFIDLLIFLLFVINTKFEASKKIFFL